MIVNIARTVTRGSDRFCWSVAVPQRRRPSSASGHDFDPEHTSIGRLPAIGMWARGVSKYLAEIQDRDAIVGHGFRHNDYLQLLVELGLAGSQLWGRCLPQSYSEPCGQQPRT